MARKELSTQICIAAAPSAYRLLRTLFHLYRLKCNRFARC